MRSTHRFVLTALALAALTAAVALGTSCRSQGKRAPVVAIGADAAALRTAFNADVGKVRLIVLVSPS